MDDELNMVDSLKQQCMDLQEQLSGLQENYDEAIDELDKTKADLQKKSDLCTMYDHILETRSVELDQMTNKCVVDEQRINDLECTVDTLAARITKLTKND